MKTINLENNMPVVLKKNENTPRCAVCFYFKIMHVEKKAGIYALLNRLFLQGTKKRSAEQLAIELEENAIEFTCELKQDFIRFKLQFLNEDLEKAFEILEDVVKNSTLDDFEKEVVKFKGEILARLDNPKFRTVDNFNKNIFKNHYYGHTHTKVLETLDLITKSDVQLSYEDLLENSRKVISIAGDFEENEILNLVKKHFGDLKCGKECRNNLPSPILTETEVVKIEKNDASQAQIIQGWHAPTLYDKDYAAIMVMNTMLGSSGLSSRLFMELRDKKGLAYVVRSNYEVFENAALISVYIATEPKNIKTSLAGFKEELEKIKNIPVSVQELENAKNNLIGKRQFFAETNLQQASLIAYHEDKGLGADFEEKFHEMIKNVSVDDIKRVANLCFKDPYVLVVLAPKKYLDF